MQVKTKSLFTNKINMHCYCNLFKKIYNISEMY